MSDAYKITIEIPGSIQSKFITLHGRGAWALKRLVCAGKRGVTPSDNPAPRWSDYVFRLRRAGLAIETVTEANSGIFRGTHGRYVLRTLVNVIALTEAV